MMTTFLSDNGFSADKAGLIFIKDMTKEVSPVGKLHAHLKVTFSDTGLTKFDLHATVRLAVDAELLAGVSDERATGRAIWIYGFNTFHSPQKASWWMKHGGVTVQELKKYCRNLSSSVRSWETELERTGGDPKYKLGASQIAKMGFE